MSVSIQVTSRTGETRTLPAQDDMSIMETLRNAGFGDIQALCGGSCSCATCHVFVAEADLALFGEASNDENDLLDFSESRQPNSRLACQLRMNGIERDVSVTVAPEE